MKKNLKTLTILTTAILISLNTINVSAYSKTELNQKKQEINTMKSSLEQTRTQKQLLNSTKEQLASYLTKNSEQLHSIYQKLNTQKTKVKNLKININDNLGQIQRLNTELNNIKEQTLNTKNEIENVNTKIAQTKKMIKIHNLDLKKTFKYLQKTNGITTALKYLYHSRTFNGVVQQYNAIGQVNAYHKAIIERSVRDNKLLDQQQQTLEVLKNKLLQNAATVQNSQDVINNKVALLNNNLDLSAKLQSNLDHLNQVKTQEQVVTNSKLQLVKNKYNKLVTAEAQASDQIQAKQYEVNVYAREMTLEERAKINARIAKEQEAQQNAIKRSTNTNKQSYNRSTFIPTIKPQARPAAVHSVVTNSGSWIFPKTCRNMTEMYGEYHPELYGSYDNGYHHAVDYACGFGTQIYAPTWGKIVSIDYSPYAYGTSIVFATNYNGSQYKLIIGHLSNVNVYQGQSVSPGQVIGYEGSTGNSTGSHTHFELWKNGFHMDPGVLWN